MRWIVLFLLECCMGSVYAQQEAEAISRIESKRYEAMTNADTGYLRFILSDDLVYTHSNGLVETKTDFIQSISSKKIVYKQIGVREQKIKLHQKTAVVTGVLHVAGSLNGKDFDIDLRYTNVYIKEKEWKLLAWQSLKI
jgi:hypothetical protein